MLIAGCGYVGSAFAGLCLAEGRQVFAIRRNPGNLPRRITPIRADLLEPAELPELPQGLSAVIYAVSADHHTDPSYTAAYVTGLRNLLMAVQGSGQHPRVIFISSTGVYGQDEGEWVDEDSPVSTAHFSGKRLVQGEEIVSRYTGTGIVLRLSGIYGPGRTPIIDQIRNGTAKYTRLPLYTNRIHLDDCAGMLSHLMTIDEPERLYLGSDDDPATRNEVLGWLASRIGSPLRDDAIEGESVERSRGSKRCRNQKIKDSGYQLKYPSYREGYEAILASRAEPRERSGGANK